MYFSSPYLGQIAKFISQIQNFERVLDLTQFGPGEIFLLMAQGGVDSTQHIHTSITPELQNIKNLFLLHKKLNFLT